MWIFEKLCEKFIEPNDLGLMDECTHLGNYSLPVDQELIEVGVYSLEAGYLVNRIFGKPDMW